MKEAVPGKNGLRRLFLCGVFLVPCSITNIQFHRHCIGHHSCSHIHNLLLIDKAPVLCGLAVPKLYDVYATCGEGLIRSESHGAV